MTVFCESMRFHVRDRFESGDARRMEVFATLIQDCAGMRTVKAPEVVWNEVEEGRAFAPLLKVGNQEAQQLMDALYAAGVRPSAGEKAAGAFEAQGRHLEDMRRLVFEKGVQG